MARRTPHHPPRHPFARERRPLRRFYAHLVASLAAQAAVLVVALATDAVSGWCAAVLLTAALAVGAHASVAFRPVVHDSTSP